MHSGGKLWSRNPTYTVRTIIRLNKIAWKKITLHIKQITNNEIEHKCYVSSRILIAASSLCIVQQFHPNRCDNFSNHRRCLLLGCTAQNRFHTSRVLRDVKINSTIEFMYDLKKSKPCSQGARRQLSTTSSVHPGQLMTWLQNIVGWSRQSMSG